MIDSILNSYKSYGGYLWQELANPSWHNYFSWLIGVSAFFFLMEAIVPWRKKQSLFRQDFWLDFFYMFFNFFLFSLIIYNAASDLDKIQTKADTLPDDVDFNHNISIEVNAGYNCDYSTNTGVTIIEGNMTVSDGTVTIQSGTLQVQ